jgi:hypothetical protein
LRSFPEDLGRAQTGVVRLLRLIRVSGLAVAVCLVGAVGTDASAAPAPPPPPAVTGIAPATGSTAGGTVVTILGSEFSPSSTVDFGVFSAEQLTFVSPRKLVAKAPSHSVATVDVRVIDGSQRSAKSAADHFSYLAPPPPVVKKVSPSSGPDFGGTTVIITGTGFTSTSIVKFAWIPATQVVFDSSTELTVTSPPKQPSTVDVQVRNGPNISAKSSADQFTFIKK